MCRVIAGNAKQPSILSQMIAEAHEIREKQSAHRAHVINNVAIKSQNQAEDSVGIQILCTNNMYNSCTYVTLLSLL